MRVIFMGTPEFSVPALHAIAREHEVVAVYSQPPRAAGRGQQPRPSPVQRAAQELGLPQRVPTTLRPPEEHEAFAALGADVAVVVAYGLILPPPILAAPRLGCLNIHASLLPRWRGAAPIQRAILAGDTRTGISIMQMEAGLDTGPVLAEQPTPIGPQETAADLHDRLSQMGATLIVRTLAHLPLPARPQPEQGVTYAAKIDKAEARIDWSQPAGLIDRQIRALSPFPGAWCMIGEERVKVLRSRPATGQGQPGEVLSGLTIACGEGAIEILEAQRPGRKPLPAAELLRGMSLPPVLD